MIIKSKKGHTPDFELKIVCESNLQAVKTIERLFPDYIFKELKISNGYNIKSNNVYTIKIHGMAKKTDTKH